MCSEPRFSHALDRVAVEPQLRAAAEPAAGSRREPAPLPRIEFESGTRDEGGHVILRTKVNDNPAGIVDRSRSDVILERSPPCQHAVSARRDSWGDG